MNGMKRLLCLAVACGMFGCFQGCPNTEPGGNANMKTNDTEKSTPTDGTVGESPRTITGGPGLALETDSPPNPKEEETLR